MEFLDFTAKNHYQNNSIPHSRQKKKPTQKEIAKYLKLANSLIQEMMKTLELLHQVHLVINLYSL